MEKKGLILVVSAPSGAGKSSICQRVLASCPTLSFCVSHTSRAPRPVEVDGQDYHFIPPEEFRRRIGQGVFVEWIENYGNLYGTSFRAMNDVLQRGQDVLLDVEPRGAKAIKEKFPGAVFVFVLPPTLAELKNRLEKRGHESPEAIRARFGQARRELEEVLWYDYTIMNDDLDIAVNSMIAIYRAETCKTIRLRDAIDRFLKQS